MSFLSKIFLAWHTISTRYHEALLNGCLDNELNKNIRNKIKYHQNKIQELNTGPDPRP